MRIIIVLLVSSVLVNSCGTSKKTSSVPRARYATSQADLLDQSTFKLTSISDDDSYGVTPENPVMVGGVKSNEGPLNERRFLNALVGPNGEKITYNRTGSCCPFKSPNGMFQNGALLDRYQVSYEGRDKPLYIYINMYDFGILKAPKGFTYRKDAGI